VTTFLVGRGVTGVVSPKRLGGVTLGPTRPPGMLLCVTRPGRTGLLGFVMRIATWNVNSLKARLEKVSWWLERARPMCC
jgi:hypothetical protein